eukprot:9273174-Prorocentrum_lima.AAC.1
MVDLCHAHSTGLTTIYQWFIDRLPFHYHIATPNEPLHGPNTGINSMVVRASFAASVYSLIGTAH